MDHIDPDFPISDPETASLSSSLAHSLRRFLNQAAAVKADRQVVRDLIGELDELSRRLEPNVGSEAEAIWRRARREDPTALLPAFSYHRDGQRLVGHVRFGRFHVGRLAAHGGAITLVFDEILGALVASGGRTSARTAYLRVDFRALVPLETDLEIEAWFSLEEGRKHFVRGQIKNGDVVCAEAEGLWVALRSDQI